MNANTKLALLNFIDAVEKLAVGTVHMIGQDDCGKILDDCYKLKESLKKDETLP